MTETAAARRLRAADAGRLREVGDRQLPEGLSRDLRAGAPAGRARTGRGAARAGDLCAARRGDGPLRRRRRRSCARWRRAGARTRRRRRRSSPRRSSSPRASRGIAKERMLFWAYRTLGPHLPAPSLAAVWLQCASERACSAPTACCARSATSGETKGPFEIGAELFRRILAHPRRRRDRAPAIRRPNLEDHIGFDDGRIRLAPEPMLAEIAPRGGDARPRAIRSIRSCSPPACARAGRRTRSSAIPTWRKGRGPHCALNLSPADATHARRARRRPVRVVHAPRRADAAGADRPEAAWPATSGCRTASAWCPSTARRPDVDGANQNELTDVADRDPFTGIPHHRYVRVPDRARLSAAQARGGTSAGVSSATARRGSSRAARASRGPRRRLATPSTPTLPVTSGSTGTLPSAIA